MNSKAHTGIGNEEGPWENFRDVRIVLCISLEVGPEVLSLRNVEDKVC
jgi:hypothetical protein